MPPLKPVLFIIGLFLLVLGAAMLVPALADAVARNPDWKVFAASAAVTVFSGIALVLGWRGGSMEMDLRQGFLLTTGAWLTISAFGALPFQFSSLQLDYADAFFETVSGLTTTGSTVLVGLHDMPPGILLWRSILQWIGGVGIVVMAVAMMPFLRVGGMHLFRTESSDRSDKALPRISQVATGITSIYAILTAACALSYWAAGMTAFDAVNHAMTTLSTGGYSTYDDSLGHFPQPSIHWLAVLFMLLGGLPFTLYVKMVHGNPLALLGDQQVRTFVRFLAVSVLILVAWRVAVNGAPFMESLRAVAFSVVSVVTTTGYAKTDYSLWDAFPVAAFFVLTLAGGCTGSTAGGIKMFRHGVMMVAFKEQMFRMIEPNGVFVARYGGRALGPDIMTSAAIFVFQFFAMTMLLAVALCGFGLDVVTALTGAATAMANVGPGLGPVIGPAGNFATLPDGAKWLLSAGMLMGRLEIFTILVLLTPAFWRD